MQAEHHHHFKVPHFVAQQAGAVIDMGQKRRPVAEDVAQPKSFKRAKRATSYNVEPRPDWHEPSTSDNATINTDSTYENASSMLQAENEQYSKHSGSSGDSRFLTTIMASGTLEDRISALTLLVQQAPLHNVRALESLIGLARKKSRDHSLAALAALKDLFGQGALLPNRKLLTFAKQEQDGEAAHKATVSSVISWAYEDWLKKKYFEVVQILEERCNDEIAYIRGRALTYVWELLRDKPEQEENLLSLLIQKFSDNTPKVASRASYLLLQLQTVHPNMKSVIIGSTQEYLASRKEPYYAVITLNQTMLAQHEQDVANQLLDIYFTLFVRALKSETGKQRDVDEPEGQARDKLLSQVLTGINRAYAYADATKFDEHIDVLYRITHSANFNTAVQSLMLLQRISGDSERYYRTLYESLLDPRLISSSKQVMYLNLIYKSLKADTTSVKVVQAFIKRLLQVIEVHEPPFINSVLWLVHELLQTYPSIKVMLTEGQQDLDEEHFYDASEQEEQATGHQAESNRPSGRYDPRKRDPAHAHAELSALWDLLPLLAHYHPSVAVLAQGVLQSKALSKPDPTTHTLLHFLDRFMYRAPKKAGGLQGSSIMQPSAASAAADMLFKPSNTKSSATPVNTSSFLQKQIQDVAPEDVFFHSYFSKAGTKRKAKQKKTRTEDDDDDDNDNDSDVGEDEIWKAITNSQPDVEGVDSDDDDDDDLSIGDLESGSDEMSEGGIDLGGDMDEPDMLEFESDEDGDDDDDSTPKDIDDGQEVEAETGNKVEEVSAAKAQRKKSREEKKKLKHLPTFANADDYAQLLANEPDDL